MTSPTRAPSPAARKSPSSVGGLLGLVAGAFLVLAACGEGESTKGAEAGATHGQAPAQAMARPVEVMRVKVETVANRQQLPGRARAYSEAEIRPQVTGLIQKRLFTEGETVAEGQSLYQIDAAEYEAAFASAQASLARSEARAASSRETLMRFQNLADVNAISQQDYDDARSNVQQAEADVAMARASMRSAQINLQRTTIKAPISGTIGRSSVTPGALVTQNQAQALARIVKLDPIFVDLTTSSSQLLTYRQALESGSIKLNEEGATPVRIFLENGTSYSHDGQLAFSEVNVDENAGSVVLRAVVPNPNGLLLPGMFVKAEVEAGRFSNVILVPQAVVTRTPRGDAVAYVVNAENLVEARTLELSGTSGSQWIVSGGLEDGDAVIVSGLQTIRPGMSVTPRDADQARVATLQKG